MTSPYDTIGQEQLPVDVGKLKERAAKLQEKLQGFLEKEFEQGFENEAVDGDNWMLRQKLWAECGVKVEAVKLCLEKIENMLEILKDLPEVEIEATEAYTPYKPDKDELPF